MCGIVGYVGDRPAWPIVVEGLRRLEYRGYDSAGVAIRQPDGDLLLRKTVGRVDGLLDDAPRPLESWGGDGGGRNGRGSSGGYGDGAGRGGNSSSGYGDGDSSGGNGDGSGGYGYGGYAGLGHTRWATHGRPSEANAHPHTDCAGRIAVVHNGIVENYLALKSELVRRGHRFKSETDTEVISHLIEEGMGAGRTLAQAMLGMAAQVQGTQAVAAMLKDGAHSICAVRLGHAGGGVTVAYRQGQGIVSSDLPALLPLIGQDGTLPVGFLEDGEVAVLTRQGVDFLDRDGRPLQKSLRPVALDDVLVDREGYRHFMLKEIMEQPQAVVAALRDRVDFAGGRVTLPELALSDGELGRIRRVVLIGCGTSLHAAQVGRHLVESLAGIPAEAESASEFRYREAFLDADTLAVAIGQSGETADTIAAMARIRHSAARLVTICNTPGSQATRLADTTLLMRAGVEIGVASSKTFLASLTILNLLAMRLGLARRGGGDGGGIGRRWAEGLARLPGLVAETLGQSDAAAEAARRYYTRRNFLYLARGINAPIAAEGALKLKEISYIHAEAYPAGEMKHGPIALIDRKMPTLAIAPADDRYDKMVNGVQEVKARDGAVLAVLTQGDGALAGIADDALYIPQAPAHLTPILATAPLQLFAYHIALRRGCDVDKPRNLAKSVTVE